eukprot:COSAG02_NODE_3188_length_7205_cov_25.313538_6_plen_139_part_00
MLQCARSPASLGGNVARSAVTVACPLLIRCSQGIPITPDRKVDYTKDFFGQPAFLTVSGQLQAEIGACALSNVYTFGPTFRAEYSFTSRHLAEFWMIEPELVFADLNDDMRLAEDYVRYCCQVSSGVVSGITTEPQAS